MAAITPQRARLGRRLRELRAAAFSSGLQFAEAVGWPQSRVSKLERGAQLPTRADLVAWLTTTGHPTSGEVLDELLSQAAAARVDYVAGRSVLEGGGFAARQANRAAAEAATTKIVEYQPGMIPGLLQTAGYARELLTNTIGGLHDLADAAIETEAIVAERVRRQEILYRPEQALEILIGEAALYNRPGESSTMIGQLDRLIGLAGLGTLSLGIVPFATPMTVLPLCNFTIHDDQVVIIETLAGEQRHDDPDEVSTYLNATAALRQVAATNDAALALIRRAGDAQRGDAT